MHILLVHGAAHDETCWQHLRPCLANEQLTVHTITLGGHGQTLNNALRVTMHTYAQDVCNKLASIGEPCILLGHSMGGMVISAAAELRPELVKSLVYLTAFVPAAKGSSMLSLIFSHKKHSPTTMNPGIGGISLFKGTLRFNHNIIKDALYNECNTDLLMLCDQYLCPQPIRPMLSRVKVTEQRYGAIPKFYIECTKDNGLTLEAQRSMQKNQHFNTVQTLESGHSPFLSMPKQLAECINNIINHK